MQTTMTFKDVLEIRTQVCAQGAPMENPQLTALFLPIVLEHERNEG